MVNENKVKIMTKMAIYEKHNGRTMIKSNRYSKTNYIFFGIMKSLVAAVIGFIALVAVVAAFNAQWVMDRLNSLKFSEVGILIAGSFAIVAALMAIVSAFVYSYRYDASRLELKEYYSRLKKLERFYSSKK